MSKFRPLAFGFHAHCDVGSLDSSSTAASKIKRAAELGRPADCVTDHGTMSTIATHWMEAEKFSKKNTPVQSVHGIELYVIDPNMPWKEFKNGKKEPKYFHLTVLFKDKEAYKYFCQLTPKMEERAILKFGEAKPLALLEELEPISGHIVIGSGCLVGGVSKYITEWTLGKEERYDIARKMYTKIRDIAGPGNFFCEIMPHAVDKNWVRPDIDKSTRKIITPGTFAPILDPEHVWPSAFQRRVWSAVSSC
jgi:DNA polymerase-3 subunit alpha